MLDVVHAEDLKFVKCSNCEKKLLKVFSKEASGEISYYIVAKCPFCSDRSFPYPVYKTIKILPNDDVCYSGYDEDTKNNAVIYSLKKKANV